jgi:hypothetical protein
MEDFVKEFGIDGKLKNMALGNAYYMAARLSYFDPTVPGRKWLIKSIKYRRGVPEELNIIHLLFLLAFPISYKFSMFLRRK